MDLEFTKGLPSIRRGALVLDAALFGLHGALPLGLATFTPLGDPRDDHLRADEGKDRQDRCTDVDERGTTPPTSQAAGRCRRSSGRRRRANPVGRRPRSNCW